MGADYHYSRDGQSFGPVSVEQLRQLAIQGQISGTDLVWKEGMAEWVPAARFKGLIPAAAVAPAHTMRTPLGQPSAARTAVVPPAAEADEFRLREPAPAPVLPPTAQPPAALPEPEGAETPEWLDTGKAHAKAILTDLRTMDLRREVIPIDETNLVPLLKDGIFWFATLLGIVPIMIGTLTRTDAQAVVFALFFAAVWGVLFRSAILKDNTSWRLLLAAMFFTGILGTIIAATIEKLFLSKDFPAHESYVIALFKFVFMVGPVEELCKALPVVGYLLWKRSAARPMTVVLVGIFSGLGFAAFENLGYGQLAILQAAVKTEAGGIRGLAEGVQGAVVNGMLRSLSCVFCHAVWAGILAYFLASASILRRQWGALFVVGLVLTSALHGGYDWFEGIQPTLAALIAGGSFVLFYGYVAKLRQLIASVRDNDLAGVTDVASQLTVA